LALSSLGSTQAFRLRCSRKSSAGGCFRRCPRCCGLRSSLASDWNTSSPERARSSSSRWRDRPTAWNWERPGARDAAYHFASLDYPATERRFNCYLAEFLPVPSGQLRPHDHAGVEFIHVIQGTLSVHMNGEEHALEAG